MKSGFFFFCAFLFFAAPVLAQTGIGMMPLLNTTAADEKTPPETVAMIYQKLSGKAPDFNNWAMQSDTYKAAPDLQKSMVMEQEAANLRHIFSLTTLAEPIIVTDEIVISEYSPKNGGFSLEGFGDDRFFAYSFAGNNYAVIVPDLATHQWQPVDIEQAGPIDLAAEKHSRKLVATLYITPVMADNRAAFPLDGKNYWLISGELMRFTLTEPGREKPLFERNITTVKATDAKASEDLRNLYQNQR